MRADPPVFPALPLRDGGRVTAAVRERGPTDLRAAIRYVRDLPYGRPRDREDPVAVLEEGRGTCSTKHALLARLCSEQAVSDVQLTLGFYEMTEHNTPGVGPVLAAHDLEALPEAHCYLTYEGDRFDFTREPGDAAPIDRFCHEEPIEPAQVGGYKTARHREFLADWLDRRDCDLTLEAAWAVREECIASLSADPPD